jgi:hypothetical protein
MAFSGMLRRAAACSVRRLLVTASVFPSSPILVTLMKEALRSYETSVLTRALQRNITEDSILHSHRSENLKSYIGYSSLILVPLMIEAITSFELWFQQDPYGVTSQKTAFF